MWELKEPEPVKLIIGILAADQLCLDAAIRMCEQNFGSVDIISPRWDFTFTNYYKKEIGPSPLKQFVSIEKLIHPAELPQTKLISNQLEEQLSSELAEKLSKPLPRPVNLDPGIIEPSKLVLASTKNFSHRMYIGQKIYAEVTLIYDKKKWTPLLYTYPDHRQQCYFDFFDLVRNKLLEQLKS